MFPSNKDIPVHKRAAARLRKQQLEFEQRASQVRDPDQLIQFIRDEAAQIYRGGERKIVLNFGVPVTNFIDWALSAKVIGADETEPYVKQLLRKTFLKRVKPDLKQELQPSMLTTFECKYGAGADLTFEVQISVLSPR